LKISLALQRFRMPLLAAAVVLVSTRAWAQTATIGDTIETMWLRSIGEGYLTAGLVLLVLVVGVAAIVGRVAPERRKRLRVPALSFAAFVMTIGAGLLASVLHKQEWAVRICAVGVIFEHVTLVELFAVSVFDVALPRLWTTPPKIARDLAVGVGYFAALMALFSRFGVDASSLFTTSAVASLVIAVSLQPTLSNVFTGLALQLDGSIGEGDWIHLPDGTEGRDRQIRWRYTVVETRNWDTLIIPNATLAQQNILVLGRREGQALQHRMWVYFQVGFDHSPARVLSVVNDGLQASPIECVAPDPKIHCICFDIGGQNHESSATYAIRYWLTDLGRDDPTSSLVRVRLHAALNRAGIPLALPRRLVAMEGPSPEASAAREAAETARRVGLLEALPFFQSLTAPERVTIAGKLRFVPFVAGEIMTRQGAEAHWLYIMANGTADVRVVSPEGEDLFVAQLAGPAIFGEMGLMTGAPRSANVIATSIVDCYRLDKEGFKEIILARPEVAHAISDVLEKRAAERARNSPIAHAQGNHEHQHGHMLGAIQRFFGLSDEALSLRDPKA
jgi:small-conductance mechanosensitive channel/CRP-like cAMP-binding protein